MRPRKKSKKRHGGNKKRGGNREASGGRRKPSGTELWLGDITEEHASVKKLKQLLYTHTPHGIPQPAVKRFVKKGYRSKTGQRMGYAILSFGCKEDAEAALQLSLIHI